MKKREASIFTDSGTLSIPDNWESLSEQAFLSVVANLMDFSSGRKSPMKVKVEYARQALKECGHALRTQDDVFDMMALAEKVTFPFRIKYDDEQALDTLSVAEREQFHSTDPHRIEHPLARAIAQRNAYSYMLNACFCAQLLPEITADGRKYQAYTVSTGYDMLSTSMTALQYLDARQLMNQPDSLPLLAAVLYCPGQYDPKQAHDLAPTMEKLDAVTLSAIQLNFLAFDTFLLTRTPFSILQDREGPAKPAAPIATGPIEGLYSLASAGYGNLDQVEQMNVIKYLTLMRKQLIESVQTMHSSGMKMTEIAQKSGLSFATLNKILQ